jgi:sugar O-acyltransferase (sialic acid O-acetyltransferase NeuD family)
MRDVIFGLIGAGGFGREVMPFVRKSVSRTLRRNEAEISVLFIETWKPQREEVNGYPLLSLEQFLGLDGEKYFNVAVSGGRDREALVAAVGGAAAPLGLFSDQTLFLDCNQFADAPIFCPNTVVTSNARIGRFFHCNIYSYVAHDCVIGDYVTFAPGVRCNGRVEIADYAYIGTNAVIREGAKEKPLRIGKGAVVGMGSVVTKDVPDGITVIGNPAKPFVRQ